MNNRIGVFGALLLLVVCTAGAFGPGAPAQSISPRQNGKLVFLWNDLSRIQIHTINPDGSGQTRLADEAVAPAFSPDGGRIAFVRGFRDGNEQIYVMNTDGSGERRLTNDPGSDAPVFSPDGTKLAFTKRKVDGSGGIYVMNADGSEETRVPHSEGSDFEPTFSPDGTKLAVTSTRPDCSPAPGCTTFPGSSEIDVINLDGSGRTRLTHDGGGPIAGGAIGNGAPDFSPDGTTIAFTRRGRIWVMNADGSDQRPLTSSMASAVARSSSGVASRGDGAPSYSPDGKKIAFTSNRDGNYEIYVMNADGSGQTRVTNDPAGNFVPDWGTYPASNPQPNPQHLTVTAARIPKACTSRAFRTRVRISTSAPLKSVRVFLDGRRIAKSRRHSFTVRVPVRRLRAGRHRLTVKATDAAGNRTRRSFRFRVCGARRPRFLH